MNAPTPTLNPYVPIAVKALTDIAVGALVRNSNATVQAAKAQIVVIVGEAFVEAGGGDVTDAMAAIDAAVESAIAQKTTDPATLAAATTVVAWVSSKAVAFQQFLAGGTITAALLGQLLTQVGNEAVAVANKYIPATPAAQPAAS